MADAEKRYQMYRAEMRDARVRIAALEAQVRDLKRRREETPWWETSGGVLVAVMITVAVVAVFAMISLTSPRAEEMVRIIQASGEVQGQ